MMRPGTWFVLLAAFAMQPLRAAESVDYVRDVKPLLAKRCYACHGALQQKNGLRLDTAAALLKGGEAGGVVVPGKPTDSLLVQVVTGAAGFRMPPAGDGTPLSEAEIDVLRRWIAAGATGPAQEEPQVAPQDYWSYQPPVRVAPPAVTRAGWVRGPIDAFVAAEHERLQLAPRPAAAPAIWLRRVHLDLIGVPPTRDELHAFQADTEPDATERVVDRLLAHPGYGERWGRHWMDVWRYSDWYGSRGINEIRYSQRHIWRWRDWIVGALNQDESYARMIAAMLAGDELAPTDPGTLAATGFLGRNWYKFDRNVWLFETVEQTSQAFLAVTLKCARCHDHKFDPLTQEDYYRFRAVFEPHDVRTDRLSADTATEKDATLGEVLRDGVARIYDKQPDVPTFLFQRGDSRFPDEKQRLVPGVPAVFRAGELTVSPLNLPVEAFYPSLRPELAAGLTAQARDKVARAEQEIVLRRDSAAQARRTAETAAADPARPAQPPAIFHTDFAQQEPELWKPLSGLWAWEHGRLAQKQVTSFATVVLQKTLPAQFSLRLRYRTLSPGTIRSVGFSFDYQDQGNSQDVYTSTGDAQQTIQAFHRQNGQQHYPTAGIVPATLKVGEETIVEASVRGSQLTLRLHGEQKLQYVLPIPRRDGRFALWVHDGAAEFLELDIRPLQPSLDDLRRASRAAEDALALQEKRLATARAQVEALAARLAAERSRYGGGDAERAALTLAASRAHYAATLAAREEELLAADHYLRETQAAGVGAPLAEAEKKLAAARMAVELARKLHDQPDGKYDPLGDQYPPTSTGRRLALARWIGGARHPRTSRVAVNHIWLRHFGQAIVPSVANFGLNGDRPSHPQLFDWLAIELEESGWRMKPLHRQLALSATYRQASLEGHDAEAARRIDPHNRYLWRMNTRRMEAEVVRDSVLAAATLLDARPGGPEVPEGEGQSNYRRSLYFRITPNERMRFLETFDAADPNGCYRRRESVVPQQALVLMNSALALDAARLLAERLSADAPRSAPDGQERFVVAAFEQILSRSPSTAEIQACQEFLAEQATAALSPGGATFPAGNPLRRPPASDPHQRAREDLVHVLFNHNDFVTIR